MSLGVALQRGRAQVNVLAQQQRNRFAQSTRAWAWVAHGAHTSSKDEKVLQYNPKAKSSLHRACTTDNQDSLVEGIYQQQCAYPTVPGESSG